MDIDNYSMDEQPLQDISVQENNTDDSYSSSSFSLSDSDDSEGMDEFGMSRGIFTNETAPGVKRVTILDPVVEKLQCFLDSGLLARDSMFYSLLENSVNYVFWLNERKRNHSLQFQWDSEVLQFVETLEYHGGRRVVNLLRGSGHEGEGGSGIHTFDWQKWNWPLPGKTTRDKQYQGYTTEDGIHAHLLQSFLLSCISERTLPLYEDEKVKVFPVVLAKDAMQIKPGLLYDSRQGKLVGSTINIDYKFVRENPEPDKEMLKKSMVQEAEVSCLTTLDSQLALPIGVRHLSKGGSSAESAETIKQEMREINVCLCHLQQKLIETKNGVIKSHAKCYSYCPSCVEIKKVCADCKRKGHQNVEPELRACDQCLNNDKKCNRLAVIGVTQDSESRNAGGQRMLMEEKAGKENPDLNVVSVFPDAVHVAKRKRQSFSNWFLWIDDVRVNLVQLRELRNDPSLYPKLSEKIPLNAVRNRDRQDVDSILQISDVAVTNALKDSAVVVTHTVVPEKYRITDDNKKRNT